MKLHLIRLKKENSSIESELHQGLKPLPHKTTQARWKRKERKCLPTASNPEDSYLHKETLLYLRDPKIIAGNGVGRWQEPEYKEGCWEFVYPSNVSNYTYKVSPAWLLRYELKKDENNEHARVDEENPMRS